MTELDFKTIGSKIRQRRQSLNITQEFVANKLDINPSHISNIECGRANPSLTALVHIGNILHCSVDTFLSEEYSFTFDHIDTDFLDSQLQKKIDSLDSDKKGRLLEILNLIW